MSTAKNNALEVELGQIITNTDVDLECSYLRLLALYSVREIYEVIDDLGDLNGKTSGELRVVLDRFRERIQEILKRYQPQQKSDANLRNLTEETAKEFNMTLEQLLNTLKGQN